MGGIQIELRDSVINRLYPGYGLICSLGINVGVSTDEAHRYFMTAGHCTQSVFSNVGALVYQPDSATNPTAIGVEVSNPDARSGIGTCPNGYTCKYSDAALFKYYGAGASNFAYLAKDSSFSSTMSVNGSLFRVDSFHVVNDISEANLLAADTVSGQYDTYMHKVGRTTGWTFGPVVHTCVTVRFTGKALLCQYQVAAQADYGDSGSPTFWWVCCNPNETWIGGLLVDNIPGYYYTFSSITGIKNDFANLVTH